MSEQGESPGAQRVWRANCSFCGAPVEFRSAASPMAVCSYCKSTLVREGDALRRIGESAALFDDHSPLGLGVRGSYQGAPFTLIGRLQLAYRDDEGDEGRWTEWHALFDNGRSAALSEDNGAYVLAVEAQLARVLPVRELMAASVGQDLIIDSKPWVLSSRVKVKVHAAEGELQAQPDFKQTHLVLELRNTQGEVLSVEPEGTPPRTDIGRSVQLADLKLSGIPDAKQPSEGKLKGKGVECPNCGAALAPMLDDSKSIVCGSCKSVIDISKGLGKDLAFYRQDNTLEPLIALGRTGSLNVGGKVDNWQVVGYQERVDIPESQEDEQTFWREYLLYNRMQGFAFLVDAEDGWSVVKPVTGVPALKSDTLIYQGSTYRKQYTYPAKTTYVLGEFYWPVKKQQRTLNSDFKGTGVASNLRLNREQSGQEITWSAGETIEAEALAKAFRLPAKTLTAFKRDVGSSSGSHGWLLILVVAAVIILFIVLLAQCSHDGCNDVRNTYGESSAEYQQCRNRSSSSGSGYSSHGSSWGGYSSGGSHK